MKAISVGLIFVVFTITLVTSFRVNLKEVCEVEGELRPHHECNKYYICDNGNLVVQICSDATYFSPELGYCDHIDNVDGCEGGTRPPVGATTEAPVTTEEPIVTTEEPIVTTEEPIVTTEEPIVTTEEPIFTTEEPIVTTEEPIVTTEEPIVTTEEPIVTTEEPIVTTEEPIVTTEEPIVTTEEPIVTTEEPAVTTEEPAVTTEEPAVTTEEPVVTTEEPSVTTQEPVITTEEPLFCETDGVYKKPFPGDCSLYILCVHFEAFIQHCPANMFYDPSLEECNIADLVPECNEVPLCSGSEVIYKPIPGNCTAYIICAFGEVYAGYCPSGTLFDPNPEVLQCNIASEVECSETLFFVQSSNKGKSKRHQSASAYLPHVPHSYPEYVDDNRVYFA